MMEIVLSNMQVFVVDLPGTPGGKILRFVGTDGNVFSIPLDQNAARIVAAQLTTGLIVAGGPLPPRGANGKEN